MNTKEIAKSLIYQYFPERLYQNIVKIHYLRKVKRSEMSSEKDLPILSLFVKRGDYVIDAGANIGMYTYWLSRLVGNDGFVYSFEPVPETFDILSNNVRKLGLSNVRLFNVAVSDKDGIGSIAIPKNRLGTRNLYRARMVEEERDDLSVDAVKVQVKRLDDVVLGSDTPISLIKIDVEGHEWLVLKGSMSIVHECTPVLFVEVSDWGWGYGGEANGVFGVLMDEGYRCYWSDGGDIRLCSGGEKCANYFFLTDEHIKEFRDKRETGKNMVALS